ncbi:hypothetical protein Y032_0003g1457 [Ancylostoma ceylanicum]|uniref:Thrombospondin-like N-terminal domain-containing protein n=1 Tax=Ancylostoma ceylanicum TaxID=53326 RepID=A0A016VZL9_9BILA|nr:hypothetical protein Y032_0003g1457 [Ancylostoma ceylanicum]
MAHERSAIVIIEEISSPNLSPLTDYLRTVSGEVVDQDGETEVDLLVPVESALNSDPRVFRAKGIDSLPAIGIQRGVEIAVPYRLYLPRRFFPQFSLLASVKPMDRRGGYLFAIVNPYDTMVDVGVLLEPAGSGQTNISLIYSSRRDATSRAIASFIVPEFVQQWTQIAFEVNKDSVTLYFKCIRFAEREISDLPQLTMEDAHKLYIGSAGPILGSGFEVYFLDFLISDFQRVRRTGFTHNEGSFVSSTNITLLGHLWIYSLDTKRVETIIANPGRRHLS